MIMFKSLKEKAILKQGLIFVVLMAVLYFFVLSPFLRESSSILDDELERKVGDIKKYIARTGSLPSRESFDEFEKQNIALKNKLKDLADFVDPEKTRVSETSTEAGLYFIEKLHSSVKKFLDQEVSSGVKIPENLGFGDGLPKENMVDTLLRQLETAELATDILLNGKLLELSAIKPLKALDYIEPLSKDVFYTEIPIQISIKTNTETLMGLLLQLKNQSPIVSVKELHIKSSDPVTGDIEASMVLSTFRVARVKE
ncbi:MAG: type 4a pilus biogenesis protein PilO [Candidatus Omnitrophica bacterium]|nr:type 4a pilus biogenesis protein PilO [Candidatus Omnitrophota bacterium]